jgi:hypothetical protein
MVMIIALRVLKEGRVTWLEGEGVHPLFILTVGELSRMEKKTQRQNIVAYMCE